MKPEYDSHGVPKLSLANPRAQVLFPTGQYTYAFGNTPGLGLMEHFGTSRTYDSLQILLLGSGDVRNLLFTISELSQRPRDAIPGSLSFHLNDHDPSILARDAIILEIALSINPDSESDVEFLWNLWYNLALSGEELKRLQAILENLTSPKYVSNVVQFGSKDVFTECLQIWNDWLRLELNIDDVSTQRKSLMVFGLNLTQHENQPDTKQENINFLTAVSSLTNTTMKQLFSPFDELKLGRKCLERPSPLYQEVYSYFLSGCTSEVQTSSKVNPTLIRPFEHKWKVHYGSCPFSGFIPIDRYNNSLIFCTYFLSCCFDIYSGTLYARLFSWLTFIVAFKQGLAGELPIKSFVSAINFQLTARFVTVKVSHDLTIWLDAKVCLFSAKMIFLCQYLRLTPVGWEA